MEDPLEDRRDLLLGGREAGHLGVGRVGQEEVDALLAEPGEGPQVGDPAVERQLVHLEVAGVEHQPGAGADRDRERVGDRVVDRDELEVEGPEADPVALADLVVDGLARAGARAACCRAAPASARSRPAGCRRARAAGTAWRRCGPRGRGSGPAPRRRRAGPGSGSKSGRIRSTPGWFSSGKSTPQSTISSRPSYSKTVMLRPTSPRPPSGMIRSPPRLEVGRGGTVRGGGGTWTRSRQIRPDASRPARSAATSSSVQGHQRGAHGAVVDHTEQLQAPPWRWSRRSWAPT